MWGAIVAGGQAIISLFQLAWSNPTLGAIISTGIGLASAVEQRIEEEYREREMELLAEFHDWVGNTGVMLASYLGLTAGISSLVGGAGESAAAAVGAAIDIDEAYWLQVIGVPMVGF